MTAEAVPSNRGFFGFAARGDVLRRADIADEALQSDPDDLAALGTCDPAVPVRQPLAGKGSERREDDAHQRGRDQRFDQREAGNAGASVGMAPHHLVGLLRRRTVSTPRIAPDGACTRITSVSGNHGESGTGAMPPPV